MQWFDANSFLVKLAVMGLLLGCLMTAMAQQQQIPIPTPRTPGVPTQSPTSSDENDQDTMAHRAMIQQAQRRNDQRQQDIVNDTAKLLKLTEQLKTEVENGGKDQTPVSMTKKVEEIEKLAKAVKEKMRGN
jgi:hypothetical protein